MKLIKNLQRNSEILFQPGLFLFLLEVEAQIVFTLFLFLAHFRDRTRRTGSSSEKNVKS